jgi:hypothetical protein
MSTKSTPKKTPKATTSLAKTKVRRAAPKKPYTLPAVALELFEEFAHPLAIVDGVERDSGGADDPYWKWVDDLIRDVLTTDGSDERHDGEHLRHTQSGRTLERAARQAGFVIGFEYCRRLIEETHIKGGRR